jgi:hypothetical protein
MQAGEMTLKNKKTAGNQRFFSVGADGKDLNPRRTEPPVTVFSREDAFGSTMRVYGSPGTVLATVRRGSDVDRR